MESNKVQIRVDTDVIGMDEFVEQVMRINDIRDFERVENFTKPGVIFVNKEQKVSLNDMIYGCHIVEFDPRLVSEYMTVSTMMDMCAGQGEMSEETEFYLATVTSLSDFRRKLDQKYLGRYTIHLDKKQSDKMDTFYRRNFDKEPIDFMKALVCGIIEGNLHQVDMYSYLVDFDLAGLDRNCAVLRYFYALNKIFD